MKIKVPKIYLLEKQTLVRMAFQWGMFVSYLGSLYPWFMWSMGGYYVIFSAMLLTGALLLSRTMETPFFTRRAFLLPLLSYAALSFYQVLAVKSLPTAYIANCFNLVVVFSLFIVDRKELIRLSDFLSRVMAIFLSVSIPFFLLRIAGFPMPSTPVTFLDGYYSFDNYYFFMLDDRFLSAIFPRFQSVFLEPNHLGTATVLLLFTQCGKWRRWYNIVLLVATLISFSLSAYVLLVVTIVLHLWLRRRHFIGKLLIAVLLLSGTVTASFFYNDGENLLHDLIVLRLEMDDGELNEDSRVTQDFESEFDSYLHSSDILFGRDMDDQFEGNSGYQVYIYENGFVGLLLVILFYLVSLYDCADRRCWVATMLIFVLSFIARGYPLWYNYYIPFYCMAMGGLAIGTIAAPADGDKKDSE